MFNAYSKEKKVVTLLNLTRTEIEQMKDNKYFCPVCDHPVRIKNGKVKLPHFSHYNNSTCSIYSEGETLEHLALKAVFAKWCEKEAIEYELEKYLPALNQRPDLLIGNIALEIQCSPLSAQRLVERTQNYQKHGYIVIWICGKKLFSNHQTLNELAKNLCYYSDRVGFYLWSADLDKEELTIDYHIEEDFKKKLYSTKKSWSFYSYFLLEIFNFPKNSNVYIQRKYKVGQLINAYYSELNRKLYRRDEKIRKLQSELYNNRLHLIQLPNWFYYPGLPLFCCRESDILLKIGIWNLVQFFDQNVFKYSELIQLLKTNLDQSAGLFYELPNIPSEILQIYCLNQMLRQLIVCNHLIRVENGWKIEIGFSKYSISDVRKWLKKIENKCLITATPIKNVIR
ncbi:competence protein CoiA [Enterococcus sp. AZ126]|uniref:competence protein CoiA n=1 Tax=Enterococcus sp. AZ126 TaxID=2774635 RepID=UPI003F27E571